MRTNQLKATLQKSYYGKAKVHEDDDFIVLQSYETDVLAIDKEQNKIVRLWSGWSATTAKHVNDFLLQNGFPKLSKKEWLLLPCTNKRNVYKVYYSNGFVVHSSNALFTKDEAQRETERIENNNRRLWAWYE